MERIEGQVKNQEELAKEVLSWIVCAMRPLSILELQHALAIELNEPRLDESNLSDIGDIVSACAGLVTIDKESNIIRLVHYTAQEFFERTHNRWFPGVETNIASICITYLSFDVFKTGFCRTDAELKERFKDNQFFKYAVKNWGHHARKSPTLSQSFSQAIIDFLTSEAKVEAASQGLLDAIFLAPSRYATRFPNRMKQLQLAVYFGLEGAVKLLLEKYNVTVESKDFDGRILLSWAARNGHIHTVKLLLENGAAVDKNTDEDDESPSPLVYALKMGHIDTAKLLLENGAEVDSKDGRMLLSWAIRRGHIDIVKLLLENGAEADSIDFDGRTPLSWAARNGHIDIVKLLLENDAEIDKKDDEDGGSPLVFATRNGHIDTVKLLLENGAEADSKDSDGRTPLSWAAGNGSETIVTLLPELGKADINATDKDGRTPLWWAANGGYLKISEQLQKKGADAKVFHQLHEYELLSPTLSRVRLENGWFYIKAE
jgi:ankyrin repeat protein